jgi:hypothetical protein
VDGARRLDFASLGSTYASSREREKWLNHEVILDELVFEAGSLSIHLQTGPERGIGGPRTTGCPSYPIRGKGDVVTVSLVSPMILQSL